MSTAQTLEYETRPRRRWRTAIVVAVPLLVIAIAAGGWRYHARARAYVAEAYADWRFARMFDRAVGELTADNNLWRAPSEATNATPGPAERRLDELLAAAPKWIASYRGSHPNLVLFVRKGHTAGRQWLAFACVNQTGLEVYTFDRSNRANAAYERSHETRPFWGLGSSRSGTLDVAVATVEAQGDVVQTLVKINGGRNTIDWSIVPSGSVMPGITTAPVGGVTRLTVAAALPRTGWTSRSDDWWPETHGLRLIEGPGPTHELIGAPGAAAVGFVPDGRLAVATPGKWKLIGVDGKAAPTELALPRSKGNEIFAFSPDGRFLFIGGTSEPAWLARTLEGGASPLGDTAGMVHPAFIDDATLMLLDNVSLRRINCRTGQSTAENMPIEYAPQIAFATGLKAFTSVKFQGVRVIDSKGSTKGTFDSIQGIHQLSLSPDGRWLAMKGQSGLRLVEVASGRVLWDHDMNHDLHTARSRIKWSTDGTLGGAAGNEYVYVWCTREPRWVARFPHGRSGYWPDVALSPDGRAMAATAASSTNVAYWPDFQAAVRKQMPASGK